MRSQRLLAGFGGLGAHLVGNLFPALGPGCSLLYPIWLPGASEKQTGLSIGISEGRGWQVCRYALFILLPDCCDIFPSLPGNTWRGTDFPSLVVQQCPAI